MSPISSFEENCIDTNKKQSYKETFKEYELPDKYYLLEMYNKQKELQQFLVSKNKTHKFPNRIEDVIKLDVQTAIYHLFCMQIEFNELKVELRKLINADDLRRLPSDFIDARYELIDMFFFMFNVGVYTGLDILSVVEEVAERTHHSTHLTIDNTSKDFNNVDEINIAIDNLMNYIDKLPWKAWKDYDYKSFDFQNPKLIEYYANAVYYLIEYAKMTFNETDKSLFNLYMNKWEENIRRQEDKDSGYVLPVNY